MLADGLAEATARLHCRNAKTIFRDAVERELLDRSPFAKLKSAAIAANRDRYVTPDETSAIIEACPDVQWRVLFGLMRLGGLRCPSETHGITWGDVDWERRLLSVYASKTDRTRLVPIMPELFEILQNAFDEAEEGAVQIVTLSRYNLHRNFKKILKTAGLEPWEDLFQTLRRSCETQLAMTCPQHAVSAWVGHSQRVSERSLPPSHRGAIRPCDESHESVRPIRWERSGKRSSTARHRSARLGRRQVPRGGDQRRNPRPGDGGSGCRPIKVLRSRAFPPLRPQAAGQRGGRDSNPQPPDRQSGTLSN